MSLPLVCTQPFAGMAKGTMVYRPADIAKYLATQPWNFVQVNVFVPVLDLLGGSVNSGYALRRLLAEYTGYAVNVIRLNDSAQLDIGFTSGGDFDWATLIAFAGSHTVNIAKWYDQVGSNDLIAFGGGTSAAPALVISGSGAVSVGTRHAALMNGTYNNWLVNNSAAGVVGTNTGSVFAVANAASGAAGNSAAGWWQLPTLLACASANSNGNALSLGFVQGGSLYSPPSFLPDRYSGSWLGTATDRLTPVTYTYATDQIFGVRWNTSDATPMKGYIGGGSPSTSADASAADAAVNLVLGKGGNSFTAPFVGSIAEVIISSGELSLADSNALGANQAAYYGVPWSNIST